VTLAQTLTLLIAPLGAVGLGLFAYWLAQRDS
jgi:hypothetical protein